MTAYEFVAYLHEVAAAASLVAGVAAAALFGAETGVAASFCAWVAVAASFGAGLDENDASVCGSHQSPKTRTDSRPPKIECCVTCPLAFSILEGV